MTEYAELHESVFLGFFSTLEEDIKLKALYWTSSQAMAEIYSTPLFHLWPIASCLSRFSLKYLCMTQRYLANR
jgi:hypothetical protein